MLFNPFSALTSKIYGALAIAALVFAGVQTARIEGFLFIHGLKQDIADRDRKLEDFRLASKVAEAQQKQLDADVRASNERVVEHAQRDHKRVEQAVDAALAEFNRTHRMPGSARCGPGAAAQAAVPADPAPPAGADTAPDMVAIPRAEHDQTVRAAVRGEERRAFLGELVAQGLAVEVPDPAF